MASSCRKPAQLVFDADISERWATFEFDFTHFVNVAHRADPDSLKASLLLNLVGPDAMRRARTFTYAPAVLDDNNVVITPAESASDPACLLRKFREICDLPSNRILERARFFTRKQLPDEPVECFIADLRYLAQRCRFGDMTEQLTRDILVTGMRDQKLRCELLRDPDLTLEKAMHACRLSEVVVLPDDHRDSGNKSVNLAGFRRPQPRVENNAFLPRVNPGPGEVPQKRCPNCNYMHHRLSTCPAYGKACNLCKKLNHFSAACRSSRSRGRQVQISRPSLNMLRQSDGCYDLQPNIAESYDEDPINSPEDSHVFTLLQAPGQRPDPSVSVTVNDVTFLAKLDTGAKVNVLSINLFNKIRNNEPLIADNATLHAYGGEILRPAGRATLTCVLQKATRNLVFYVLNSDCVTLLGNRACQDLGLVSFDRTVHKVQLSFNPVAEYQDLFNDDLGKLPLTYHISIDPNIEPVVRAAHRVSHAMKDRVEAMLNNMVEKGVLEAVSDPTDWVSTMVATIKKDKNEIRVCINPKDLNLAIRRPHYPMRSVEDVAAQVGQATVFSVLDAKNSFWQIPLDEASSDLTTFATPFGRFKFLRMPFGIKSASEVFQRTMEQIFSDLPCAIIVDDILVYGKDIAEHDLNLRRVLDRARKANLKLNPKKCRFRVSEVTYVGHVFTPNGLKPDPLKAAAISEMAAPTDVPGLQRFLGMVNYLGKFIPNLSELSAPLRQLTKKDIAWVWLPHHQQAFDCLKSKLINTPTLRFFDARRPITVTCDASKFGLGAACLQSVDGSLHPVSYASRTMTDTEQRYAQIEKELLAVVFACSKFNDFLFGSRFTVETDHQPLVTILNKPIHAAPARLQRMMLQLQRFDFDIIYKKGTEMHIADTLSRAPLTSCARHPYETEDLLVLGVNFIPTKQLQLLAEHTAADPVLQRLASVIKSGWPTKRSAAPPETQPFFLVRDELVLQNDVIVKGHKVVVPSSLFDFYYCAAHSGHPGVDATLAHAQCQFYWPGMAKYIRDRVSACSTCNSLAPHQQRQPLLQQPAPALAWSSLAADIFEWRGNHYLVLVDSYSNWFEVDLLTSLTSEMVIRKLRKHFSTFGSPVRLQTDNGRQFTSREFKSFADKWNFVHFTSSPEYPQSNGLAERAVRSAKLLMEQARLSNSDLYLDLLNLRNVSRDPAMGSPAQRLMSRTTRSTIPIAQRQLQPRVLEPASVQRRIQEKHDSQRRSHDRSCRPLDPLLPGQVVRLQTASGHSRLATVVGVADSPRSYLVDYEGTIYRRSRQHLLAVNEPQPQPPGPYAPPLSYQQPAAVPASVPCMPRSPHRAPGSPLRGSPVAGRGSHSPASPTPPPFPGSPAASRPPVSSALSGEGGDIRTRSGRISKPPVRYGDFV